MSMSIELEREVMGAFLGHIGDFSLQNMVNIDGRVG